MAVLIKDAAEEHINIANELYDMFKQNGIDVMVDELLSTVQKILKKV